MKSMETNRPLCKLLNLKKSAYFLILLKFLYKSFIIEKKQARVETKDTRQGDNQNNHITGPTQDAYFLTKGSHHITSHHN